MQMYASQLQWLAPTRYTLQGTAHFFFSAHFVKITNLNFFQFLPYTNCTNYTPCNYVQSISFTIYPTTTPSSNSPISNSPTTPISSHTVDIPALPHSLALSAETSNKKKKKVIQIRDETSRLQCCQDRWLEICRCRKSAVQNIVKSGPYEAVLRVRNRK
jgi:hypothetical protein